MADDGRFCTSCGAPLGGEAPAPGAPRGPSPPPVQYYSPPPKQSALPAILVVLAVVVVAVVAIAAVGVWVVSNEADAGNVDMRVNSWSPVTDMGEPAEGYDRIMVNVTMTNNRSYDIPIVWYFFLLTVNGTEHRADYEQQYSVMSSGSIPAGEARTFPVIFDIPEGADPATLSYNMYFINVSAPVP